MLDELEATFTVWLKHGDSIEVGFDRDGLDLIEVRFRTDDGKVASNIIVPDEAVPLLVEALQKITEFKRSRGESR